MVCAVQMWESRCVGASRRAVIWRVFHVAARHSLCNFADDRAVSLRQDSTYRRTRTGRISRSVIIKNWRIVLLILVTGISDIGIVRLQAHIFGLSTFPRQIVFVIGACTPRYRQIKKPFWAYNESFGHKTYWCDKCIITCERHVSICSLGRGHVRVYSL